MSVWKFFVATIGIRGLIAVVFSLASGAFHAVSLVWISRQLASNEVPSWSHSALLAICFFTGVATDFAAKRMFIRLTARSTMELRRRLTRQILSRPYEEVESIGAARLQTALIDDVAKCMQAFHGLAAAVMAIAITTGCFVYLAVLSPALLAIVGCMAVPLVIGGMLLQARTNSCIAATLRSRDQTYKQIRSVIDGAKELKVNARRRQAFFAELLDPAIAVMETQIVS
ncbi:MAG: hypothetical protein FJ267_04525, partial [Planctomycetes bacterium]|nr:hypothetical protein [Planctomycetota bacterium]